MTPNQRRIVLAILLASTCAAVPVLLCAQERVTINRDVAGVALGMTTSQVATLFKMEKREDRLVLLERQYISSAAAERRTKLNQMLGKRRFVLQGTLPQAVDEMEVLFRNGRLYQIGLHYHEKYVRSIGWDVFTLEAFKKYGSAQVSNKAETLGSISYEWADIQTKLEITKAVKITKRQLRGNTLQRLLHRYWHV
jgi:hypothetical protein